METKIELSTPIEVAVKRYNQWRKSFCLKEIPVKYFTDYQYCDDMQYVGRGKVEEFDNYDVNLGKQFAKTKIRVIEPLSSCGYLVETQSFNDMVYDVDENGIAHISVWGRSLLKEVYWRLECPLSAISVYTREDNIARYEKARKEKENETK